MYHDPTAKYLDLMRSPVMSRLRLNAFKPRFIAILLVAVLFGAVISYMWVAGYYIALGLQVPENSSVVVDKTEFNPANATFFNAILLNPSYSKSAVAVEKIRVLINQSRIEDIGTVSPTLPVTLGPGDRKNFTCRWNWGNYIGQKLALVIEASKANGAIYSLSAPPMGLGIVDTVFNASMNSDANYFHLILKSQNISSVPVNVTSIKINGENVSEVQPNLGTIMKSGSEVNFQCGWGWTNHIGENYTINVSTREGYIITSSGIVPRILEMTDVNFDPANTSQFTFTIRTTTAALNQTRVVIVYVQLTNLTRLDLSPNTQPVIPGNITRGSSATYTVSWDWRPFEGQDITLGINTYTGITVTKPITIPSPST